MTHPKRAAADGALPEGQETPRNEPSLVEALAVKIGVLVQEHGSPELRAAALALVETVQSELRQLESERSHDQPTPKPMG